MRCECGKEKNGRFIVEKICFFAKLMVFEGIKKFFVSFFKLKGRHQRKLLPGTYTETTMPSHLFRTSTPELYFYMPGSKT